MTTGESLQPALFHVESSGASTEKRACPEETAHAAIDEVLSTLAWESTTYPTDRIMPQFDNHAAIIGWLEEHRDEIETKALSKIALPEINGNPERTGFLKLREEYAYKRGLLYSQKTPGDINDVATDIVICHLHPDRYPADTMLAEPVLEIHESIIHHINITLTLLEFSRHVDTMNFSQPSLDIPLPSSLGSV